MFLLLVEMLNKYFVFGWFFENTNSCVGPSHNYIHKLKENQVMQNTQNVILIWTKIENNLCICITMS